MKRIEWKDRQPGDIGLSRAPGILSDLIAAAEREIHLPVFGFFVPSHAFIVGYHDYVIEAWLDLKEDSVAAINPCGKYDGVQLEVWRINRTENQISTAIDDYLAAFAKDKYGWPNLFGFLAEAIVEDATGRRIENPIKWSLVCSQGVLIFLRYPALEKWPHAVDLRDCDPLALRLACIANQELHA